ncbi:MAG TPA: GGDEF domain-containing protein [Burkholderiaceae bacterium]|jgi:diguanylate cyclase (GGDEF)-like protein
MQNLDTQKLLRSLAKLIEKPEIKALQLSMIKTLSEIINAESILLYEIRTLKRVSTEQAETFLMPVGYEDSFIDDTSPPMLLNQEPQFEECFQAKEVVVKKIGSPPDSVFRSIHPILGAKGVTGFLVIDTLQFIQRDHDLASTLLGLYNNYLLLLNDNQRDHLTGLLNRKSFDDKIMKMALSLSDANKRTIDKVQYCLAVLDIDHFKRVNDTYGHLLGDEVLLHFSQCMNETFREYDLLFRVGGEEFVVVLRNVDPLSAAAIMERFRRAVETHYFPQVGQVTVSIGVTFIGANDLPMTVMDRADKTLYYVKENGRNQVAFFEHLVEEGKLKDNAIEGDVELF